MFTRDIAAAGSAARIAAANARAQALAPLIAEIRQSGATNYAEVANALNARGAKAHRGGSWSGKQVKRLVKRLGA